MIARVQATTKKVLFKGVSAEVWEGMSPTGIRFHLFVTGAAMMAGQTVNTTAMEKQTDGTEKPVNKVVSAEAKFKDELGADVKVPAPETAALADVR